MMLPVRRRGVARGLRPGVQPGLQDFPEPLPTEERPLGQPLPPEERPPGPPRKQGGSTRNAIMDRVSRGMAFLSATRTSEACSPLACEGGWGGRSANTARARARKELRALPRVALASFPFLLALPLSACARHYSNDSVQVSQNLVAFDPPGTYPDIAWTSSLEEGRVRAADEHKPLIVFIRAAWSRSSVLMESTIWKDGRVLSEAPRFIAVRVDLTSAYGAPIPDFLKDYDVKNVPTTLIISSEGKILGRFTEGKAKTVTVAAAMRDAK